MALDSLTDIQLQMLDTEREWWATAARKEAAIADRFGLSAVRYYQLVGRLISSEAALAYDPVTVRRLARIAASRNAMRPLAFGETSA